MRKIQDMHIAKGWLLAFRVIVLLALSTASNAEEVITIATEEYPPHTSQTLKHNGVNCHIVSEAFALEGIAIRYHFMPGKRAYHMAQTGKMDAALPWVKRPEREKYFFYPDPVIQGGKDGFYHLKTYDLEWNPSHPNYADLAGVSVGAVLGYNYGPKFQTAEKTGVINVQRIESIEKNFRKLLLGRIKVFISQDDVGNYILNRDFTRREINLIKHTLEDNIPTEHFHLLISKKSAKGQYYLQAFNRGLRRLKQSGRYDEMLKASLRGDYIIIDGHQR